jgi:O-antigen/teichoic acid export membrane protein
MPLPSGTGWKAGLEMISASTETVVEGAATADLREKHERGKTRLRRWAGRLLTFFVGQGLVQVLNLATGFLLIRWLTVKDYAVYSLVSGFQGTVGVLVELGLGGSIVALLAGRTEKHILGGYIRSTRYYRNKFFVYLLPAIVVVFAILAIRQGLAWWMIAVLLSAILTAIYFESWTAYYSVPFMVHQDLQSYYRTPALIGGIRLVVSFVLHTASALSAWLMALMNSAAMFVQGWSYRHDARRHIDEPKNADPVMNQEVLQYIRPLIPGTVFFAIHGQITILLISWFGQTQDVAEVGALGRLGQLFLLLSAFNSVVIAPNIAKVSKPLLASRYLIFLAGAIGISIVLLLMSAWLPEVLLWIIGPKYLHLRTELVWTIAASCLGYVNSVMWTMHVARRWNFAWGVRAYIVAVVFVEICGIAFMDLSTAGGVIRLSAYTAFATFPVLVAWAIHGFLFCRPESSGIESRS